MKDEIQVLEELKSMSQRLNLKFDRDIFKFVWVTKEQEVLMTFLSACLEPVYQKYGENLEERGRNLGPFYFSEDYDLCKQKSGGQVAFSCSIPFYRKYLEQLENKEIKEKLSDYCDRVEAQIGNLEKIAVITETDDEKEKEELIEVILRHEWVHVLLEYNGILPNNWKQNEGLVTYLESYCRDAVDDLDKQNELITNPHTKIYYTNAIIFRDLLKDIDDKDKVSKIREFIN